MLIKSGADINLAMSDGKTPLHISAETGTIEVFKYLLSNGAEPTKQDKVMLKNIRKLHQNLRFQDLSFFVHLKISNVKINFFSSSEF